MKPVVLHVIPFLWSGAGRVLTRLVERQVVRYDVHVATSVSSRGLADDPSYRRRLRALRVTHHRLDSFDRAPEVVWASARRLAGLAAEIRPAVVHAHAGVPSCLAAFARQRGRDAWAVVSQVYSVGLDRPAWMDAMDAWGHAAADRVVCSAGAYETRLLASGIPPERIARVAWGVDLPPGGARPAAREADGPPVIGFLGRIERRKQQLELVRAFAALRTGFPGARLHLAGPVAEPDYARAIAREARALGVAAAVWMPGRVRDPWRFLSALTLFVSLSSDEGQGMAVLEAMAAGVPVAALPVAGIEDYLTDGQTGFALAGVSARAVAGQLEALLGDRAARGRVAREAHRLVRRHYTWARTERAMERAYAAARRAARRD
jgi:glycosyltransferase involved in cell wall biosynthesis